MNEHKSMRDALIEQIYNKMIDYKNIFFLSDDLGALTLDKLRREFKNRFINVGIAEQNLINISAGLALEGAIVYAYGIAPFVTMRPYEQIRTNLSLLSQIKEINVNLIGAGSGVSYEVSGPTHHCLEDITILRTLPNFVIFSPSDSTLTEKFVDFSIKTKKPKYIRLDGKPLPQIYDKIGTIDFEKGFCELVNGEKVCIVSTGFMTHKAIKISKLLRDKINIGVIDLFLLKPVNKDSLFNSLKKYDYVLTLEEAFINKGGLDNLILDLLNKKDSNIKLRGMGFEDQHIFMVGSREFLHKLNGLDENNIIKVIKEEAKKIYTH